MFHQRFVAFINSLHGNYIGTVHCLRATVIVVQHMAKIGAPTTMSLISTVANNTVNKFLKFCHN
jgi:hypothetical protein